MTQGSKYRGHGSQGATSRNELMQAKLTLVAARERGDIGAFTTLLGVYPAHASELTEFNASLIATSGYEHETPTSETEAIAARALARAMATVFPDQASLLAPAAALRGAFASLRELRKSRGLSQPALADRLNLGVDVLSTLEAGMIKVASIPDRLIRALGDAFSASLDQITDLLDSQVTMEPAWKRSTEGNSKDVAGAQEQDFLELVRTSPNMSAEQKAQWLDE